MANSFKNYGKAGGTGRLSKSGFRYNISKNCRLTRDDAKALPAFRKGYDQIDWSKGKEKQGDE